MAKASNSDGGVTMTGSWDEEPSPWPDEQGRSAGSSEPLKGRPQVSDAPIIWLVAGIIVAVIALALGTAGDSYLLAALGWLLGGTIAILFLAAFVHFDAKRRSEGGLARDSALVPWLRRLLVVAAGVAVAVNSWVIADAVARGNW